MKHLTDDADESTADELEKMAQHADDWAEVYEERGEYANAMEAKKDAEDLREKARQAE
jgi:lysyl-tRNA synthetase class I